MGKLSRYGNDLYNGDKGFNFVGRRGLWYLVSAVIVGLSLTAVAFNGLNFGVEFTGGSEIKVSLESSEVTQDNADRLREAVADADIENAENPTVTTAQANLVLQTESLDAEQTEQIEDVIFAEFPDATGEDISQQDIGPSWGREIAERAGIGVAVFLLLVVLFIWGYFREWKMSVAALVALFHDVAVTIGVYSLSGFQVTPAAVTGLLAILGFSLYDTVVVFDKVRENTTTLRKSTQTYSAAANLAVNQTLVRSINTSIVALIPIGAILYVGAIYLGASSLQDLALAQFVGMAAGVYSSVMLAPRVLVHLKSTEKDVQQRDSRALAKIRQADRYAAVPVYNDDEAAVTPRATVTEADFEDEPVAEGEEERSTAGSGAVGKGRVVPTAHRPVSESKAAGRQQPTRQPRSKRGKK
jgi:preprotein translocase subunit SecF